jgi:hypothetical protein
MNAKQNYKKLMREHRKKMKKLAKECHPFDWGCGLEMLMEHLYWMRDYYKNGYNVWAAEDNTWKDCSLPTRLESLNMAIQLYNGWQNLDEKYYCYVHTMEEAVQKVKEGWYLQGNPNSKIDKALGSTGLYSLSKFPTWAQTTAEYNKEYEKNRKEFFLYVSENIEGWWD